VEVIIMQIRPGIAVFVLLASIVVLPADAQWLHHPTAGAPRTPDGLVDMDAPPPRMASGTPDFSVWGWQPGPHVGSLLTAVKPEDVEPWALALVKERTEQLGRNDPANFVCLPQGPRMNLYAPIPAKIVQTPTLMVILSEDMSYRQIFLDGRALPVDPSPSFMGYSVGRWDGDTLIVETIGFKGRTWLDFAGTPHSEQLRITERIRRTSFGRLEIEETIHDPQVFAKPFTVQLGARFIPDTELLEFICNENERSHARMVATLPEEMKRNLEHAVSVPPEVLARYVGTYDLRFPENPTTPMTVPIQLAGDQLTMGGGPLVPLSPTVFAAGAIRIEFVVDAAGIATGLLVRVVEGDLHARRLPDGR
jgi:hypothetical protein